MADGRQLTGQRLALPLPDCAARPSDCDDVRLLNQLDGFDLDPRIAIGFGQPIDLARVTRDSVYLQPAGGGERIPLNRLVWSPARHTLYGHPRDPARGAHDLPDRGHRRDLRPGRQRRPSRP